MKKIYFNVSLMAILTAGVMMLSGCSQDNLLTEIIEETKEETTDVNEDGMFTATFIPGMYEPMSRLAVGGQSKAVQSLKYLIYKNNGNGQYMYYGEGDVFGADADRNSQESHSWPYAAPIELTLEAGNYKVAFLGNVNKNLFDEGCNDLLTYTPTGVWEDVKINMPEKPFGDYNMFYMDAVEVSTENPTAQVWLERKVNKVQLWRETVASDNGMILTTLLDNVVDHLGGDAPITGLLGGQLGDAISQALNGLGVGLVEDILLEPILNALSEGVLRPAVVEALAPILDAQIKANHGDAFLQELLNPWSMSDAQSAIVTFKQVPSSLDLDGKVSGYYAEGKQYGCEIKKGEGDEHNFRYFELCGLADGESSWTIGRIDIVREDLLGALLDHVTEDVILPGSLIDTGSELTYSFGPNYRYKSVYGAITLNVNESYFEDNGQSENLKLDISLGDLLDLETILAPVLNEKPNKGLIEGLLESVGDIFQGDILQAIHNLLEAVNGTVSELLKLLGLDDPLNDIIGALTGIQIHLELPININALGTNTLELTGTWGEVTTID